MGTKSTSDNKMNPAILALEALSGKIQQYISGKNYLPSSKERYALGEMKNRLELWSDGLTFVDIPDYEAAYQDARMSALEIKDKYHGLPKLPQPNKSDSFVRLQDLWEWCSDSIGIKKTEESNAEPPGSSKRNEAYIKKNNDNWVFGFNSGTAQVKFKRDNKLKGLALIEFLLTHQDEEYTPLELLKEVKQRGMGEAVPEKIYKDSDIGKIQKAIEGLKGRVKESTNFEETERLKAEIKKAEGVLHKSRNYKGESRAFSDKHRLSVSRNIDRVLNKITPQNVELYNHLDTFLERREICSYKPDSKIIWKIS